MMHRRFAHGRASGSQQIRQDAEAVFGRVGWQLGSDDLGSGRDEIIQADRVISDRAGLHFARPACDQWHSMASFVDAALAASQRSVRSTGRSVIARGNDQRVFGETIAV